MEECGAGIEGEKVVILALDGEPLSANKGAALTVAEVERVEDEHQALLGEVKGVVMVRITTTGSNLKQHGIESILGATVARGE